MKLSIRMTTLLAVIGIIAMLGSTGCTPSPQATSSNGAKVVSGPKVKTDDNGMTNEQSNIWDRLDQENDPLAIKYMYVISPFTGDILIYSSVTGKVTSSGKRLTPSTVEAVYEDYDWENGQSRGDTYSGTGFLVPWGEKGAVLTKEAPGNDGTWGTSSEYLFWTDQRDVYHQQYVTGAIIHVSSQPLGTKKAVLNYEEMPVAETKK